MRSHSREVPYLPVTRSPRRWQTIFTLSPSRRLSTSLADVRGARRAATARPLSVRTVAARRNLTSGSGTPRLPPPPVFPPPEGALAPQLRLVIRTDCSMWL